MKKSSLKKAVCGLLTLAMLLSVCMVPVAAEGGKLYQIYVTADCATAYAANGASAGDYAVMFDGIDKASGAAFQQLKPNDWVKVDFGLPVKIESYTIDLSDATGDALTKNNMNGVKTALLQVSATGGNDETEWKTVDTLDNENEEVLENNQTTTIYHTLENIGVDAPEAARYYRLKLVMLGGWGGKIFELKFFSSEQGLLGGKTVISDTKYRAAWQTSESMPGLLTDGNPETKWTANGDGNGGDAAANPHELIFDMGKYYKVNRWYLANQCWNKNGGTNIKKFALSYLSADPDGSEDWVTVVDNSTAETGADIYGGKLNSFIARYIKLQVFENAVNLRELELYGEELPEAYQANLISEPSVMPTDSLSWEGNTVSGSTLTYSVPNAQSVSYRFALPSGYSLAGAQKIDFTFSDHVEDDEAAQLRPFEICLEEGGEKYCVTFFSAAGAASRTFSVSTADFKREASEEGDGVLDLSAVTHVTVKVWGNRKDYTTTGSVTFAGLTAHKGVPVAMQAPVRLQKSAEGSWSDITLIGVESGAVRVVGDIKNLDMAAEDYTIVAALYNDGTEMLEDVAMTAINDAATGATQKFALPLDVPAEGDYAIKVFVWYADRLMPINAVHVFE